MVSMNEVEVAALVERHEVGGLFATAVRTCGSWRRAHSSGGSPLRTPWHRPGRQGASPEPTGIGPHRRRRPPWPDHRRARGADAASSYSPTRGLPLGLIITLTRTHEKSCDQLGLRRRQPLRQIRVAHHRHLQTRRANVRKSPSQRPVRPRRSRANASRFGRPSRMTSPSASSRSTPSARPNRSPPPPRVSRSRPA